MSHLQRVHVLGRCATKPHNTAVATLATTIKRHFITSTCTHTHTHSNTTSTHTAHTVTRHPLRRTFSSGQVGPNGGKLVEFNLADIGEGIAECEVLKWFVKAGDRIEQFDKICEVQSDKANVEITSRYDGIITELKYEVGQLAKVGAPLVTIETDAADSQTTAQQNDSGVQVEQAIQEEMSLTDSMTATAPTESGKRVLTSPAVRHLARQHNIDLSTLRGTGPQGRLLKEDVMNHINGTASGPSAPQPRYNMPPTQQPTPEISRTAVMPEPQFQASTSPVQPAAGYLQQDHTHQISGIQRIMVNTMNAANAVPTFGFSDEIMVDKLVELREQVKPTAEKRGVKLSYLPFIIKATSLALKHYPMINAHVNSDCTQVVHRAQHNIGLAMDTPRGLLVPNIKNVQSLSIIDIAAELNRLAALGASGKLGKSDLTGGTFTLSNIGSLGGTYMKPILVVPEVVIGAMGAFQTLPRYDKHMQLQPTKIMYISWTGDHRVLDGATVARFSTLFKSFLETPQQMLLDTR